MPPASSSVPPTIPTLHLYRQLLREISYLPPAFSSTISEHVTHQFHQHVECDAHRSKRLSRARNALRTIRSANKGNTKSMALLIDQGFGRTGRRRRQLLADFVKPTGPTDSAQLETETLEATANLRTQVSDEDSGKSDDSSEQAVALETTALETGQTSSRSVPEKSPKKVDPFDAVFKEARKIDERDTSQRTNPDDWPIEAPPTSNQRPDGVKSFESILKSARRTHAHVPIERSSPEPSPDYRQPEPLDTPKQPPNEFIRPGKRPRPDPKNRHTLLEKWDTEKLVKFLKSQRNAQSQASGGGNKTPIKTVDPNTDVRPTNIWGKAPSEILVRAKQAGWWKRHADKILPPLATGEWELLKSLSEGAQRKGEWEIPTRRIPAQLVVESDATEADWDWKAYASHPTAFVEPSRQARAKRYTGETESHPFMGKPRNPNISHRWFERRYKETWQRTSHMVQNPNTLQYKFVWGKPVNNLPSATNRQKALFQGVDAKGERLASDIPAKSQDDHK